MNYKTLDDFDFAGKRILLRSDLNSEVVGGKVILSERIIESAKTIKELLKKRARIVVLAHQGQPGKKDFISLKQHAKLLNRFVKIKFVSDVIGEKALNEIEKLGVGEALLLENARFIDDEFKPSGNNKIVQSLARLLDIYINDAFSVCHRKQTSVVSFPKVLPSGIGRTMEKELRNLEKINVKETLFILGGAKVEGSLKLAARAKKVLATGVLALAAVVAQGYTLGKSEKIYREEIKFASKIKKLGGKIVPAIDFAYDFNGKRREISVGELPCNFRLMDIGGKSVELFADEIKKAKNIFMSGTAGVCEDKKFSYGTRKLFKAIAKSKAFTIVSGGHTISAMMKMGIDKNKFDYVSLSGGALESYLAGEKLPGLEVLKIKMEKLK